MPNAIFFQRIAYYLYKKRIPLLPHLFMLLIFLLYNSKISYKTVIGKGTFCVYGGIGVLINAKSIIGENCSIGVGAKIVGKGPYIKVPEIRNNVFIGPGAVISGPVIIEDNVIIAPNAVVTKSVPKGAIVAGIPAKIIGNSSELDYDIMKNESFKDGYMDYLVDNRTKTTPARVN